MDFSFDGIKFSVSVHAPNRTKKDIEDHGGIVVPREVDADMHIIDYNRAGRSSVPKNTYSHLWVTDCIVQNRQVDEGPYLVSAIRAREDERRQRQQQQEQQQQQREAQQSPPQSGVMVAPLHHFAPVRKRVRNAFTAEDDRILVAWLRDRAAAAREADEKFGENGNGVYKMLEAQHPHHTYHSWRDRWLKKLSKTVSLTAGSQANEAPRRVRKASREPAQQPNTGEAPVEEPAREQATRPAPSRPAKGSGKGSSEAKAGAEDEDRDGDEGLDSTPGLDISDDAILDGLDALHSEQLDFLGWVETYNDHFDVYVPPSFFIGGRYLETFSLWTTVENMQGEPEERDWDQIVQQLGLDAVKYPSLKKQLAAWYEQNLGKMESFLKECLQKINSGDEGEDGEGDGGEDEEEDGGEGGGEEAEDAEGGPSKTPEPAGRSTGLFASAKRVLGIAFSNSETADKDPTPESPSKRVRFSGVAPDNDGDKDDGKSDDDDDDEQSPAFESRPTKVASTRKKTTATAGTAAAEPETQDFAYDPETQQMVDFEGDEEEGGGETGGEAGGAADADGLAGNTVDATPSQQLRTEDRVVAAPPLSLPAPRAGTRRRAAADAASASSPMSKETVRRSMPQHFTRGKQAGGGQGQEDQGNVVHQREEELPSAAVFHDSNAASSQVTAASVPASQDSATTSSVVDRFVSLRYPQDVVVRALRSTASGIGGTPGLAGVVMERMMHGGGVPRDMAGVWTAADDRLLSNKRYAEKSARYHALTVKHGEERMAARQIYLATEMARQVRRAKRVARAAARAAVHVVADAGEANGELHLS